ncbi:PAS domain-containing hybrid sensor histidine kinase/response regulator [Polyangium spumosum]|uniref:histidine kinase n=1 Tax=Polyangium spumosum TaxID=889282 RepID=A0A6N7PVI7_9BACT|nr:PAS domain S-box protein [Polyangium spumosum]MRG94074.1 PAS domain S-box protein [Polyangium spumosum]
MQTQRKQWSASLGFFVAALSLVAAVAVFTRSAAVGGDGLLFALFLSFCLAMGWMGARVRGSEKRFGDCTSLVDWLLAREVRRKVEARVLRESEERFRALAQACFDPLVLHSEGVILDVNQAFTEVFGYRREEVVGTRKQMLAPAEYRPLLEEQSTSGAETTYEAVLQRKDGSRFLAELRGGNTRVKGRPARATVIRDVTPRRGAETATRWSDELIRLLFDWIPLGMAHVSVAEGRLIRVNACFCEITGYSADELVGKTFQDITHPNDRERNGAEFREASREGRVYRAEKRYLRKDGGAVWVRVHGFFLRDIHGVIRSSTAVVEDITLAKRNEEALREADRCKDEFLAMLAHELRNPLAPIKTAVEIQKRLDLHEPRLARSRDVIERQVGHLARLLDDLLDVSRISRGRITLRRETRELGEIVGHAVESTCPLIDARKHELVLAPCAEPLPVNVDAARLTQVVSNLLNNAAKYTDDGGRIELRIERGPRSEALIRIKDNGRGIDPKDLPHVFDTFYQSTRTLDRSEGGLGIGLSLVRRLVELHGGKVEAHSDGLGKGSEFLVRLALEDRPMTDAHKPAVLTNGQCRRVLVVDDNVDAAETMAALLETLGHQVAVAHDGEAALEAVSSGSPEVVLLDIGLPRMDGYEVCRRLRDGRAARPFIVAITGYGQAEDRDRALRAGFDAHLVKPASFDAIQAVLRAA